MTNKYRSREACIDNVKRIFSGTSKNSVSTEFIYESWGRNPNEEERNKAWLSTLLTHLKYYDLVQPQYTMQNSRRVLSGVKLTDEGKRVLKREDELFKNENANDQDTSVELFSVMDKIAKFQKKYPEFDITFSIKLKDEK